MSDELPPLLHEFPPITREDDEQEALLAKLENRAYRGGYRFAYSRRPREYGYGLLPSDAWHMPFAPEAPDPATVERLIGWVMSQERHVAVRVMDYLDDPSSESLERIKEVVDVGMTMEIKHNRPATLTDLILRTLPASMPELYNLARREHVSKRPEAAVRQIIRNLVKRGTIEMDSEETFHAVQ